MPTRSITVDGSTWLVFPSGRVTQNDRDEFGLIFVQGTGSGRRVRVTRYAWWVCASFAAGGGISTTVTPVMP